MSIIAIAMIVIGLFLIFNPTFASGAEGDMMVKVTLTVEGEIQTEDLGAAGDLQKPMYYIWLDPDGDSSDARYDNGAGPLAHEIQFDTGRLRLTVINGENTYYGWYNESVSWTDTENNIQASIVDTNSLQVSFPLSLIGSPSTLEISAMASSSTSSALDNTGTGSGSADGWIIISDTSVEASYEESDIISETVSTNFNITKIEAQIYSEAQTEDTTDDTDTTDDAMDSEEDDTETGGIGIEIWLLLIIILVIIVIAVIVLRKKK